MFECLFHINTHIFSFYICLYIELLKIKLEWKYGSYDSHWEEPHIYIFLFMTRILSMLICVVVNHFNRNLYVGLLVIV